MAAREILYVVGLVLCLAAVTLVRMVYFDGAPPRADQTQFAEWAGQVAGAGRVLPSPADGQSWLEAARTDQGSAVGQVVAGVAAVAGQMFALVALGWFLLLNAIGLDGPLAGLVGGLGAQALTLLVLGLVPRWSRFRPIGDDVQELSWIGALAVAFVVFNALVAGVGLAAPASLGLATLLLAILVMGRLLRRMAEEPDERAGILSVLPSVLLQAVAVYTSRDNLILVPAAFGVALLIHPGLGLRRFSALGWYVGLSLLTMIPAAGLAWVLWYPEPGAHLIATAGVVRDGVLRAVSGDAMIFADASIAWARPLLDALSAPAFALGLIGLFLLAVRHGVLLPFVTVMVHFLISVVIQGAAEARLPLGPLPVVPLFLVGLATFLVVAVQVLRSGWPRVFVTGFGVTAVVAAVIVLGWYAGAQWPGIAVLPA